MDGLRIPIFDDRHKLVITSDSGALRVYRGVMHVDDPDELRGYSRFLWWQWQAQNGQFAEAPAERYTRQMFREAAAWLLDACDEADITTPSELQRALAAILREVSATPADKEQGSKLPRGAMLSQERVEAAYEAAARFEASRPSYAPPTVTEVARHLIDNFGAGNAMSEPHVRVRHVESNVSRWRDDPHYEGAVEHYRRAVFGPPSPRAVKNG
jgi:hypothetical protein